MRTAYRVLAWTIAAGVALQAASVAWGFFTVILYVEDGGVFTSGYDYESNVGIMIHRFVGTGLIPLAALALLIVSFFARIPSGTRRAGVLFGLVLLQIALVFLAFVVAWAGALHGVNALAILLTAGWSARRARSDGVEDQRALEPAAA